MTPKNVYNKISNQKLYITLCHQWRMPNCIVNNIIFDIINFEHVTEITSNLFWITDRLQDFHLLLDKKTGRSPNNTE